MCLKSKSIQVNKKLFIKKCPRAQQNTLLETLLKNRLWHRCFSVNSVKFLKTPFLQNTSGRLFLYIAAKKAFPSIYFVPFPFFYAQIILLVYERKIWDAI